ncbi:hypothetical protein [Tannockella kyphosi]|uniref:hypothetical protein n=1 Tax=Tannockella kyphosi TaxID=2899121 RepID=UPI0020134EC3|nr:hypothetical protein [Tannockella kyphosi]
MLKQLIKIRLKGLLSQLTKGGKKEGKVSLSKCILYGLLFLYVFGVLFALAFSGFNIIYPVFEMLEILWLYFAMMAVFAILLSFIGSVFLAKQEIYDAKDNELLLSLPLKEMDILLSRVIVVLLSNYVYCALVIIPAYLVYIQYQGISVLQALFFFITFLILPLFVLSITCLFAWLITFFMRYVKNKNIFTFVTYISFFMIYLYVVSSGASYVNYLLAQGERIADVVKRVVPPLYYMAIGMQEESIISYLIFVLCMIVPFLFVMKVLANNFIKLSLSKSKQNKIEYVKKEMVQKTIFQSLLKREWKHYSSNPMVMLNGSMGIIFNLIGIGAFIFYYSDIKEFILTSGISLVDAKELLVPLIIIALCYCTSLNMISCASISLEGNRLWIIKSLPIKTFDILMVKVLFHILLCVPTQLLFSLVVAIGFGFDILSVLLVTIVPFLLICLVSSGGLLINLWKPKFDWVNETVVVKQSMAVVITMFGTMAFVILLTVAYFKLFDNFITMYQYCCFVFAFLVVCNGLSIYLLKTYGVKRFESFIG